MNSNLTPDQWAQVDEFIRASQLIGAIKTYRELTGADLLTAKNAVEARDHSLRSGQAPSAPAGAAAPAPAELSGDQWRQIDEHLFAARKLHAIKLYRDWTECDLVDAKRLIEAREKELGEKFPTRFTKGRGCLGVIVVTIAVVGPAIYGLVRIFT